MSAAADHGSTPRTRLAERAIVSAAVAAIVLLVARAAAADATPSLALEPAPAGDRGIAVERAGVRAHLTPSVRLAFEYADQPLVLTTAAQEFDAVVSRQLWLHALVSLPLWHRVMIHLDAPFAQSSADEAPPSATAVRSSGDFGLGDLRLGARVMVLGTGEEAPVQAQLAISSALWLPTEGEEYAGDGAVRARAGVAVDVSSPRLYGAFAGGVRTRPSVQLPGAVVSRVGTSIPLGLALGFFADAERQLALGSELTADLTGRGARGRPRPAAARTGRSRCGWAARAAWSPSAWISRTRRWSIAWWRRSARASVRARRKRRRASSPATTTTAPVRRCVSSPTAVASRAKTANRGWQRGFAKLPR